MCLALLVEEIRRGPSLGREETYAEPTENRAARWRSGLPGESMDHTRALAPAASLASRRALFSVSLVVKYTCENNVWFD